MAATRSRGFAFCPRPPHHSAGQRRSFAMREWWRGGVIYQVYPRSFQDTNGDGVGDLPGIMRRLDHIASLGVAAVCLSPITQSPQADMGYVGSDYKEVDRLFCTLEDFVALFERALALGRKVIMV